MIIDGNKVIQYNQILMKENQKAEIDLKLSEKDITRIVLRFESSNQDKEKARLQIEGGKDNIVQLVMINWSAALGMGKYIELGTSDEGKKIYVYLLVYTIGSLRKIDMEFLMEG